MSGARKQCTVNKQGTFHDVGFKFEYLLNQIERCLSWRVISVSCPNMGDALQPSVWIVGENNTFWFENDAFPFEAILTVTTKVDAKSIYLSQNND